MEEADKQIVNFDKTPAFSQGDGASLPRGRFATLGLWENGPLFLPKLYRGSHPQLSIRGAAGALTSRMLEGLSYREQYR